MMDDTVGTLLTSLDFSGIEDALGQSGDLTQLSFAQIVEKLITGEMDFSQGLGQMIWQFFLGEWELNRKYLLYNIYGFQMTFSFFLPRQNALALSGIPARPPLYGRLRAPVFTSPFAVPE